MGELQRPHHSGNEKRRLQDRRLMRTGERYKTVVWWLEISGIGLGLSGLFVGGQCDGARAKRGPLAVLAARA